MNVSTLGHKRSSGSVRPETAAERTKVYKLRSRTRVPKSEKGKVNRDVRKKMKAVKKEWTEEQCKNIEKETMSGNSKEAYNTLKAPTKAQQVKSAVIEDSSGNILTESTAVPN